MHSLLIGGAFAFLLLAPCFVASRLGLEHADEAVLPNGESAAARGNR